MREGARTPTRLVRARHAALLAIVTAGSGCNGPLSTTEWHDDGDYRWRELAVPRRGKAGFTLLAPSRTGIRFTNSLSVEQSLHNDHLLIGSGVTLGDVDDDGRVDVYLSRLVGNNVLYRNLGDWRFEDITEQAGVAAPDRYSTGAVFADVDGDGDLDLFTTALGGPNALFLNNGGGAFTEATAAAGVASDRGSTTATLADVDGDGDLDLYVANYKVAGAADLIEPPQGNYAPVIREGGEIKVAPGYRDHFRIVERYGRRIVTEQAEPDWLYLNDGTGRFARASFTDGRFRDAEGHVLETAPDDFGLAARFYDVDRDGDSDLYVCNDFDDPDHFWLNDGSGRFQAVSPLALRTTSNASMTADFADIDRDGDVDFFVADMLSRDRRRRQMQHPLHLTLPKPIGVIDDRRQYERNTLLLNRGDGTFAQVAELAGVAASEWTWGALFLDVDLDGYEDLLITNGYLRNVRDADTMERIQRLSGTPWRDRKLLYPPLLTENVAFRNNGDLTFQETSGDWGYAVGDDISHGMATGDLDGDGDLDVVVNRMNAPAAIYRNDAVTPRVAIRLIGKPPNTRSVGARVSVIANGLPVQEREITAGGLYLSHADPQLTFGAGRAETVTVEVRWPDGRRSRVEAGPNRQYEIRERGATASDASGDRSAPVDPHFADVSDRLRHIHTEQPFDDLVRQPLLPNMLSRLGPGVTWYDVDGDGDDDLLVASGAGGRFGYFRNDGGQFNEVVLDDSVAYDQTAVLPVPDAAGGLRLLIGQSNYEARSVEEVKAIAAVLELVLKGPRGFARAAAPPMTSSVGPLALADYDRDGDLDLFVGGRVIPGLYPIAASSMLFRNDGGRFAPDAANGHVLEHIGLVSGATFSDVDQDGDPDLLLALEWGPVRLLLNDGARFGIAGIEWGLDGLRSRWNGVTTADVDGDGRLDLVATSWGRNTRYRPGPDRPLLLYHDDFDRNGFWDVVFAQQAQRGKAVHPLDRFDRLREAIPSLRTRVASYSDYAKLTVGELFSVPENRLRRLEATTYDHTVFLNRGDTFVAVPLPLEAQFAPASHAAVGDFDGDGDEDLFLTQNFFPTETTAPRYDAGRSLWFEGDGAGGFATVSARRSGIEVYGDQRGAALADFDGDGRVDLAVSQNGTATKLYRNVGARRGLRVRLQGLPDNPHAIGAVIRLVYRDGRGPAREVRGGGGYWSFDSPVQVMGLRAEPVAVWVRWPDGGASETAVPPGAREITVPRPGHDVAVRVP